LDTISEVQKPNEDTLLTAVSSELSEFETTIPFVAEETETDATLESAVTLPASSVDEHNGLEQSEGQNTQPVNEKGCFLKHSLGKFHSAALTEDNRLYTWGNNGGGQLGFESTSSDLWGDAFTGIPTLVPTLSGVKDVWLGYNKSMASTSNGDFFVWGGGWHMILGLDGIDDGHSPIMMPNLKNVVDVAMEFHYSAAVTSDGDLYTWGLNSYGQLGYVSTSSIEITDQILPFTPLPTRVPGVCNVVSVSLGANHIAALTSNGDLYTWGSDYSGQLGHDYTTTDSLGYPYTCTPAKIPGLENVTAVSSGGSVTAAICENGDLYTWGENYYGQLGYPSVEITDMGQPYTSVPTKVPGLSNVIAVALSGSHCAAITAAGDLYTWGSNSSGELGHGDMRGRRSPTKVTGLTNVISISLEPYFSAAITADGDLYTWGANNRGQLGHESSESDSIGYPCTFSPTRVTGLSNVLSVSFGGVHGAAITADGHIYTWGGNMNGQLGDGTMENRSLPVKIKIKEE